MKTSISDLILDSIAVKTALLDDGNLLAQIE